MVAYRQPIHSGVGGRETCSVGFSAPHAPAQNLRGIFVERYRVYRLNAGHHIVAFRDIEAGSDEEALSLAHCVAEAEQWTGFEVWQCERLLGPAGAAARLQQDAAKRQDISGPHH